MRSIDLYTAVRALDDDILERSETAFYGQKETGWLKWGAMAACVGLILTVALTTLPGILRGPGSVLPPPNPAPGPTVSEDEQQNNGEPLQPPGEREITINWDNVAVNESAGLAPNAAPLYLHLAVLFRGQISRRRVIPSVVFISTYGSCTGSRFPISSNRTVSSSSEQGFTRSAASGSENHPGHDLWKRW